MQNVFDELEKEVQAARMAMSAVDRQAGQMAKLLAGRLRNLERTYQNKETLRRLKAELKGFNMATGCWKGP